jgi:acyl-CoA synthetase (AMP-forming)/AMP-acid ligase II
MATSAASTYDQLRAEHEWRVPERYNIAQDVCDKHPRDKPAMVWERYDGARRDLTWGELQDLSNQAANWLAAHGVTRGDRVAVVLVADVLGDVVALGDVPAVLLQHLLVAAEAVLAEAHYSSLPSDLARG